MPVASKILTRMGIGAALGGTAGTLYGLGMDNDSVLKSGLIGTAVGGLLGSSPAIVEHLSSLWEPAKQLSGRRTLKLLSAPKKLTPDMMAAMDPEIAKWKSIDEAKQRAAAKAKAARAARAYAGRLSDMGGFDPFIGRF